MIDARGTTINVQDEVVFSGRRYDAIHFSHSKISWGKVVAITEKTVQIEDQNGDVLRKHAHNVVVVALA